MDIVLILTAIAFPILTIYFLFKKNKRKYSALFGLLTIIVFATFNVMIQNEDAVKEGFLSATDKTDAASAGITNAAEWTNEKREAFKAQKEAKALEEKANALKAEIAKRKEEVCDNENNKDEAFYASTELVRNVLKSPSSAEFPSSKQAIITKVGECNFLVDSYVDSQNALGVMLRSKYSIIVIFEPEKAIWRYTALKIQ